MNKSQTESLNSKKAGYGEGLVMGSSPRNVVNLVGLQLLRVSGWLFYSFFLLAADRETVLYMDISFLNVIFSYTEITSLLRTSVVIAVSQNN